jgi:hypothetical protein
MIDSYNIEKEGRNTGPCTLCSCPSWRTDSGDPPSCINIRPPTKQLCGHSEDAHSSPSNVRSSLSIYRSIQKNLSPSDQRILSQVIQEAANPLVAAGFSEKGPLSVESGGAATISHAGENVYVGPVKCGETATLNVLGGAVVRFELWFPLAKMPCGEWTVAGEGSRQYIACNNGGSCPEGEQGDMRATGISGQFPSNVSFTV